MGTDISLYAEWRSQEHWQFIGTMVKNEMYEYDPEYETAYRPASLYDIRNYSLFAILADIRNGFMEDKYEYIAPLRGLPDNLSPELEAWSELRRVRDGDSGWLTLEELVAFDWYGKSRRKYARVDERVAHLFHPECSFPFREWPKGIQCSYSIALKEQANASWTETYAEAAGSDFMELLDEMAKKYGISHDVRFIFWFDH